MLERCPSQAQTLQVALLITHTDNKMNALLKTSTTSTACSFKFDFALLPNFAAERLPTPAARLCQHTTLDASHDSPALPAHRLPTSRAQDGAELHAHHAPPPTPQAVNSVHMGSL